MVERETIIEKLRALYDEAVIPSQSVIDTFKDFFGEGRIDVQNYQLRDFSAFLSVLESYEHRDIVSVSNFSGEFEEFAQGYRDEWASKKLLEYVPDIKVLDMPSYKEKVFSLIGNNNYFTILVWWDKVTVTNDNDRSVEIEDLYAQVNIMYNGRLCNTFKLNRTTYPLVQWVSDYAHSHLNGINKTELSKFRTPCLGSGPIIETGITLKLRYDINIWGLFCQELDNYVHVESIAGVPYKYLEKIGTGRIMETGNNIISLENLKSYSHIGRDTIKRILKDFLKKSSIKISYRDGAYYLGEPFVVYWLRLSNFFIEEYNRDYDSGRASYTIRDMNNYEFIECFIANNTVFKSNIMDNISSALNKVGTPMFTFKGETKKLNIINIGEISARNKTYLVDRDMAVFLLTKVLKFINLKYGKQTEFNINKIF